MLSHERLLEVQKGRSQKSNFLKESIKLNCNFQRGGVGVGYRSILYVLNRSLN